MIYFYISLEIGSEAMGAFGVMIGMLHYAGLYVQINSAFKTVGFGEVDNYLTGNGNL